MFLFLLKNIVKLSRRQSSFCKDIVLKLSTLLNHGSVIVVSWVFWENSLLKHMAESYSEPSQMSKMEFYAELVNGCQQLTILGSSHRRCSIKKNMFLKISQNSQENTMCQNPFFNKVTERETLAQVFSWIVAGKCFSCKKYVFYRTPPVSPIFSLKVSS